jgi:hypothetical protein
VTRAAERWNLPRARTSRQTTVRLPLIFRYAEGDQWRELLAVSLKRITSAR